MFLYFEKVKKLLGIFFVLGFVFRVDFPWSPSAALAQSPPRSLGSYTDWSVWSVSTDYGDVCYMVSEPKKRQGLEQRRGAAVLVTYNYDYVEIDGRETAVSDVTVQTGYSFEPIRPVGVAVADQSFELVPYGARARTVYKRAPLESDGVVERTPLEAKEAADPLISVMSIHDSFVVTATSTDGAVTTDTYSLLGFLKAYNAIRNTCIDQAPSDR